MGLHPLHKDMANKDNYVASAGLSRYHRLKLNRERAEHEIESFVESMECDDEDNVHYLLTQVTNL